VFDVVVTDVDPDALTELPGADEAGEVLAVLVDPNVTGLPPAVYVVGNEGVIGRFLLAATTNPTPPDSLPATIELDGQTYVFNEVEEEVDTRAMQPVGLVSSEGEGILVYAERGRQDERNRVFAVARENGVAGQYVLAELVQESDLAQTGSVTPTPGTPAPENVVTTPRCDGGASDAALLPTTILFDGVEYTLAAVQTPEEAGELTTIGCVGPFEVAVTDLADRADVLYLRAGGADEQVYRYESS